MLAVSQRDVYFQFNVWDSCGNDKRTIISEDEYVVGGVPTLMTHNVVMAETLHSDKRELLESTFYLYFAMVFIAVG